MLDKKIADWDELDTTISYMVRKLDGPELGAAAVAAGNVIMAEVERRAPFRTGALKASIRSFVIPKDRMARAVIEVANSRRGLIEYYAVFLEYGTSKMASQAFMRPAFEASNQAAAAAFEQALNQALEDQAAAKNSSFFMPTR